MFGAPGSPLPLPTGWGQRRHQGGGSSSGGRKGLWGRNAGAPLETLAAELGT